MMIEVVRVLELIDPANVRQALNASGISGRELGRRLGAHGNLATRVLNGKRHHLSSDEFEAIAVALAGEGDFEGHGPDVVRAVMRGQALFERRLVQPDSEALTSVTPDLSKGGSISPLDGVRELIQAA